MVIKVYTSRACGNPRMKIQQDYIVRTLYIANIDYEEIDVGDPQREKDKLYMQKKLKLTDEDLVALPPQIFNEEEPKGEYEGFFRAVESEQTLEFLDLPRDHHHRHYASLDPLYKEGPLLHPDQMAMTESDDVEGSADISWKASDDVSPTVKQNGLPVLEMQETVTFVVKEETLPPSLEHNIMGPIDESTTDSQMMETVVEETVEHVELNHTESPPSHTKIEQENPESFATSPLNSIKEEEDDETHRNKLFSLEEEKHIEENDEESVTVTKRETVSTDKPSGREVTEKITVTRTRTVIRSEEPSAGEKPANFDSDKKDEANILDDRGFDSRADDIEESAEEGTEVVRKVTTTRISYSPQTETAIDTFFEKQIEHDGNENDKDPITSCNISRETVTETYLENIIGNKEDTQNNDAFSDEGGLEGEDEFPEDEEEEDAEAEEEAMDKITVTRTVTDTEKSPEETIDTFFEKHPDHKEAVTNGIDKTNGETHAVEKDTSPVECTESEEGRKEIDIGTEVVQKVTVTQVSYSPQTETSIDTFFEKQAEHVRNESDQTPESADDSKPGDNTGVTDISITTLSQTHAEHITTEHKPVDSSDEFDDDGDGGERVDKATIPEEEEDEDEEAEEEAIDPIAVARTVTNVEKSPEEAIDSFFEKGSNAKETPKNGNDNTDEIARSPAAESEKCDEEDEHEDEVVQKVTVAQVSYSPQTETSIDTFFEKQAEHVRNERDTAPESADDKPGSDTGTEDISRETVSQTHYEKVVTEHKHVSFSDPVSDDDEDGEREIKDEVAEEEQEEDEELEEDAIDRIIVTRTVTNVEKSPEEAIDSFFEKCAKETPENDNDKTDTENRSNEIAKSQFTESEKSDDEDEQEDEVVQRVTVTKVSYSTQTETSVDTFFEKQAEHVRNEIGTTPESADDNKTGIDTGVGDISVTIVSQTHTEQITTDHKPVDDSDNCDDDGDGGEIEDKATIPEEEEDEDEEAEEEAIDPIVVARTVTNVEKSPEEAVDSFFEKCAKQTPENDNDKTDTENRSNEIAKSQFAESEKSDDEDEQEDEVVQRVTMTKVSYSPQTETSIDTFFEKQAEHVRNEISTTPESAGDNKTGVDTGVGDISVTIVSQTHTEQITTDHKPVDDSDNCDDDGDGGEIEDKATIPEEEEDEDEEAEEEAIDPIVVARTVTNVEKSPEEAVDSFFEKCAKQTPENDNDNDKTDTENRSNEIAKSQFTESEKSDDEDEQEDEVVQRVTVTKVSYSPQTETSIDTFFEKQAEHVRNEIATTPESAGDNKTGVDTGVGDISVTIMSQTHTEQITTDHKPVDDSDNCDDDGDGGEIEDKATIPEEEEDEDEEAEEEAIDPIAVACTVTNVEKSPEEAVDSFFEKCSSSKETPKNGNDNTDEIAKSPSIESEKCDEEDEQEDEVVQKVTVTKVSYSPQTETSIDTFFEKQAEHVRNESDTAPESADDNKTGIDTGITNISMTTVTQTHFTSDPKPVDSGDTLSDDGNGDERETKDEVPEDEEEEDEEAEEEAIDKIIVTRTVTNLEKSPEETISSFFEKYTGDKTDAEDNAGVTKTETCEVLKDEDTGAEVVRKVIVTKTTNIVEESVPTDISFMIADKNIEDMDKKFEITENTTNGNTTVTSTESQDVITDSDSGAQVVKKVVVTKTTNISGQGSNGAEEMAKFMEKHGFDSLADGGSRGTVVVTKTETHKIVKDGGAGDGNVERVVVTKTVTNNDSSDEADGADNNNTVADTGNGSLTIRQKGFDEDDDGAEVIENVTVTRTSSGAEDDNKSFQKVVVTKTETVRTFKESSSEHTPSQGNNEGDTSQAESALTKHSNKDPKGESDSSSSSSDSSSSSESESDSSDDDSKLNGKKTKGVDDEKEDKKKKKTSNSSSSSSNNSSSSDDESKSAKKDKAKEGGDHIPACHTSDSDTSSAVTSDSSSEELTSDSDH